MVRRKRLEDIPVEVLDFIDGYVFLAEETPEFIARGLVSRLKQYAETLKTPFFWRPRRLCEEGNQLWTCPGHNGGIFYNRSPIGRIFVQHLGEAVFRDDLDNSVLELGDLLVHEGPALQAQKEAANNLRRGKNLLCAQRNLSLQQDRAVGAGGRGRPRLVRPQQPQSAVHGALFLAAPFRSSGDGPQRLWPDRTIYHEALDETRSAENRDNRLVEDKEAWRRERPFRVAVIEQCTYDGTINNAEMIVEKIGHLCDYILFDEAWAGFMKFHRCLPAVLRWG